MKFTKKELKGIIKICDAVGKVKDSLASDLYSKMKSLYPDAIKHDMRSMGYYKSFHFDFDKTPDKKILSALQNMGFKVTHSVGGQYECRKGDTRIFIDIGQNFIQMNVYE